MKFKACSLLILLAMLLGMTACGGKVAPTPTITDPSSITLVPFSSAEFGISGVAPDDWVELAPGEFLRGMPFTDPTVLQFQLVPDITIDQLVAAIASELGKSPESVGSAETADFIWDLYIAEHKERNIGMVMLDIALAETDAGVYAVALQAMRAEYDVLHDAVFVPAVDALVPAVVAGDVPGRPGALTEQVAVTLPERSYWPTEGWRSSTPEEQGMDSEKLAEMLTYIENENVSIDSVSIVSHV